MTAESQRNYFRHGSPDPLPTRTALRAGAWSLGYESGDLRYLAISGREAVRRIYAAVRDRNWDTVPGTLSDVEAAWSETSFRVCYTSTHRQRDIHFVWRGTIEGSEDGVITFKFDGEARSTFLKNRIGFCVLHPIRECAGKRCRLAYSDGSQTEVSFPEFIAPEQPIRHFQNLVRMAHEVLPGIWSVVEFEGDLFETEDQRNWIDASFKTFCTPLSLSRPMEIRAGTGIRQVVRCRILRKNPTRAATTAESEWRIESPRARCVTVDLREKSWPLPALGLGTASHGQLLGALEIERLRALSLAHLRVDLRLVAADWRSLLERTAGEARDLGAQVEVAVHMGEDSYEALPALAADLGRMAKSISRVLVFDERLYSTSPAGFARFREICGASLAARKVPLGAGTSGDLYQFHMYPPPAEAELLCWSMNPQVHAFDCASMAETPEAAVQQVISVRHFHPGKPLVISPITLKPRFNPVATSASSPVGSDELPPEVDPRQMSLFGACWTVAMLSALAPSEITSMTWFETSGWRGVVETQNGSGFPERFPSMPGSVFPVYHVLADFGEFLGGSVIETASSERFAVAALGLRKDHQTRLVLANLDVQARQVAIKGAAANTFGQIRQLDELTVVDSMTRPEDFRGRWKPHKGNAIDLPPCGIVALETAP